MGRALGHQLGRWGEERALRWLRERGYRIVARNYRWRGGEIDLIARDGDTLAFIEVKARTDEDFGPPEGALTPEKRRRIIRAAQHYIAEHQPGLDLRFDVVAIVGDEIRLYKDAFRADDLEGGC